jgi:hypothetical protein
MRADDPALEQLTRSFLLGTARSPAPAAAAVMRMTGSAGTSSELAALALLGQRLRFRKLGPAPAENEANLIADQRAIVPDTARALMRRLVGSAPTAAMDIASLALADTCQRRRLRPHPFDLPRLGFFVQRHRELLGATAVAWSVPRGEEPAGYFDDDTAINENNWMQLHPKMRAAFISELRKREPVRARALVFS